MNCPRCKTAITQSFDPDSIILCPGCGSRLMTRAAALRSQGKLKVPDDSSPPGGLPADVQAAGVAAANLPPSATIPPTPAMELGMAPPAAAAAGGPAPMGAATLEMLIHEMQMLRSTQMQILELLRRNAGEEAPVADDPGPDATQMLAPVRSRRRKTVLLIDDDPESQNLAVEELKQADVPVRAVDEGNAALAAIAEEKPDVVALELGLGGDMAGKDLINMIKATMEWVDIPIVLWTREPVASQKEARLSHGADEVVLKSAGAAALVTRVITLFRRA
jgi:CheY-like chemotaxis protein